MPSTHNEPARSRAAAGDEPDPPHNLSPGTRDLAALQEHNFVERWLQDHLTAVAAMVVAAGFVIRLVVAGQGFFNPDEAIHYTLFHQRSIFLAYKASLTNAHPPLIYFLLYFWQLLGRSEVMLRLPSVLAGTAFCWWTFRWVGICFSKTASLMALVIVSFSPALIDLSAELREYALLLCFVAAALYYLELAFRDNSVRHLVYFSVALYLAILSHYSAAFVVLAAGLYALVRFAAARSPRPILAAWVTGQAGAAAIYGLLYVTHLSKLHSSIPFWAAPFNSYLFHGATLHGGIADIFTFLLRSTPDIFLYLFAQTYVANLFLALWIVSLAILFVYGMIPGRTYPRSGQLALLLGLPFVAIWGAALAGKYPYVGSRHTVFLAPVAVAAVSALLASMATQKLWRGLLIAGLLMGVSNAWGHSPEALSTPANQRRALMSAAVTYMQQSIPRSDLILVDYQSSSAIEYYLCAATDIRTYPDPQGDFVPLSCNGHSIVSLDERSWELRAGNFSSAFERLAHQYGLKPGDRVWVFQTGWGVNLAAELQRYPQFRCLAPQRFGDNIAIIPFEVGPTLLPAIPGTHCAQ